MTSLIFQFTKFLITNHLAAFEHRAIAELPLGKLKDLYDTSKTGLRIYHLLEESEQNRDVSLLQEAGELLFCQATQHPYPIKDPKVIPACENGLEKKPAFGCSQSAMTTIDPDADEKLEKGSFATKGTVLNPKRVQGLTPGGPEGVSYDGTLLSPPPPNIPHASNHLPIQTTAEPTSEQPRSWEDLSLRSASLPLHDTGCQPQSYYSVAAAQASGLSFNDQRPNQLE